MKSAKIVIGAVLLCFGAWTVLLEFGGLSACPRKLGVVELVAFTLLVLVSDLILVAGAILIYSTGARRFSLPLVAAGVSVVTIVYDFLLMIASQR